MSLCLCVSPLRQTVSLDYQCEIDPTSRSASILADFHSFYYLRINQRRQEHLESLQLRCAGKRVWEVSAGIGDHTSFFIDREASMTCSEVRPELLAILRRRYPGLHILSLDLEAPEPTCPSDFDIIYWYGVLYHLRTPARALAFIAKRCRGLLLLETCVGFGDDFSENIIEEPRERASQAYGGLGCRPTRAWVFRELQRHFAQVYVPRTQPHHEQFPLDWTKPNEATYARAIFIGSRQDLSNELLTNELIKQHTR